ncbi:hypothetical protein AB432_018885 [Brevibacillus brevis]|uniref:Uncharacterized protein n=1 Tax=Brevibacillus brevis TaxID=1393 RepID=A0A2Z4MKH4_BREBE|nr:hypothetical protein AB432_018885 [Brevibacillus brevis]RAT95630.1 hypothetical protein ASG16_022795 [Brevibacillus sp. Leaf182]
MLLSDTSCAKVNSLSIMGEEKPEEELMGKRKSSPRLSATPLRRYSSSFPIEMGCIPFLHINFSSC